MYLLDSNTCIQFLNGRSIHVERRLMGTKPSSIKLCSIVKAELLYGASRSNDASAAMARLHALAQVLERDYEGTKTRIKARMPPFLLHEFEPFIVKEAP